MWTFMMASGTGEAGDRGASVGWLVFGSGSGWRVLDEFSDGS